MTDDNDNVNDFDPLDPLRILAERLSEAAQPLGLELRQFKIHVTDPGNDLAEVWFVVNPERVSQTAEHAALEREFKEQLDDDRWRAEAIGNVQRIIEADRKDDA
jgi:regulator of protease activity HflC (stomatin/prohibitin superfamily)